MRGLVDWSFEEARLVCLVSGEGQLGRVSIAASWRRLRLPAQEFARLLLGHHLDILETLVEVERLGDAADVAIAQVLNGAIDVVLIVCVANNLRDDLVDKILWGRLRRRLAGIGQCGVLTCILRGCCWWWWWWCCCCCYGCWRASCGGHRSGRTPDAWLVIISRLLLVRVHCGAAGDCCWLAGSNDWCSSCCCRDHTWLRPRLGAVLLWRVYSGQLAVMAQSIGGATWLAACGRALLKTVASEWRLGLRRARSWRVVAV